MNQERYLPNWALAPLTWRSCVQISVSDSLELMRDVQLSLWVSGSQYMLINQAELKNDISPIGLWLLSPGAPVSQAVSFTVWSKTAMSSCPCECKSCVGSTPLLRYGEYERVVFYLESTF